MKGRLFQGTHFGKLSLKMTYDYAIVSGGPVLPSPPIMSLLPCWLSLDQERHNRPDAVPGRALASVLPSQAHESAQLWGIPSLSSFLC